MIAVDVVVAGAGSDGATEAGALTVLRDVLDVRRIGGSSAGAINAVAVAAGIADLAALWRRFLTAGDLEDWHLPGPLRPLALLGRNRGMMGGRRIRAALKTSLGGMRMGDLETPCRVTVGNLEIRETEVIDSETGAHKDISVVDLLCCTSAVPFLIDAQHLRPTQRTLYTDGGTGANVPAGLWDDEPARPTVVLRFRDSKVAKPIESLPDFIRAVMDIRQDAANQAMASHKSAIHYIDLPSSGDSLDFSVTVTEVNKRIAAGEKTARAWVRRVAVAGGLV